MNRPQSSLLPLPGSPHLIEDLVDWTVELERPPNLVDGVAARYPLAEENTFLPELEFHWRPGYQSQTLPNLDGHGDLTFGRDGASHG
ncbi:MAG: hypothetical protein QOH06_3555 [Acidobacteriota bacterium]|nr:hypothetical protein [Acidobacteriota bacterium]